MWRRIRFRFGSAEKSDPMRSGSQGGGLRSRQELSRCDGQKDLLQVAAVLTARGDRRDAQAHSLADRDLVDARALPKWAVPRLASLVTTIPASKIRTKATTPSSILTEPPIVRLDPARRCLGRTSQRMATGVEVSHPLPCAPRPT